MFKHVFFIMVLTISLSVLTISANAATLYVDVNGADTNTGSSNNPFRTIQKAADVAGQVREGLILGCDTVAQCDGRILGKPADEADARRMLQTLAGRRHSVLSGVCLWDVPDRAPIVRVAVTTLQMDPLRASQAITVACWGMAR